MELKKYIDEKEITIGKAASEIGISRQYLSDIINQNRIPGKAVAFKIVEWSGKLIKLSDLWPDLRL